MYCIHEIFLCPLLHIILVPALVLTISSMWFEFYLWFGFWFGSVRLAIVTQKQEGYPRKMRDVVKMKQQLQQPQQEPLLVGQSAVYCVSSLPGRTFVCSFILVGKCPDWFFSYSFDVNYNLVIPFWFCCTLLEI